MDSLFVLSRLSFYSYEFSEAAASLTAQDKYLF